MPGAMLRITMARTLVVPEDEALQALAKSRG